MPLPAAAPGLRWRLPLALLAGLLQALSLALPGSGRTSAALQTASLAALVLLLAAPGGSGRCRGHNASLRLHGSRAQAPFSGSSARARFGRGLLLGWAFAIGWLAGTFWWLFISMHTYGGLAAPLAALAVLALAAFLGLYYALAAGLFSRCFAPLAAQQPGRAALAFAALWTLAELARGQLFTGFPWGAIGYAQLDGPLQFLPRYVGVYGLGFAAAWAAAALALARRFNWRGWRLYAALAALLAAAAALHAGRQQAIAPAAAPLRMDVALMQGNIPQDEKFVPGTGVADALRWYGGQLADSRASLIVGPETAIPLLPADLPEGYWQSLHQRFARAGQATLLGVPLGSYEAGYTNAVIGIKPGQARDYQYDKHHLVPFGEFIPPLFKWFVRLMNIPLGDFNRGALGQPSFEWRGQRLAPNICYEDLFGEDLAARFAHPAQAPTAFVNLSNIAWFGDSLAIDQHLHISRMRALEFERPMLRATNTGATAIIDHTGRVTHLLPRTTRGVLLGEFEGRQHLTPYARWAARAGTWPLWAACLALLALAGRRHQKT